MNEIREIVKKASDIESKAAYDYFFGLSRIASYGLSTEELRRVINKVAVETIIHKHLMRGLLEALDELEKMDQSVSEIEARKVEPGEIPEEFRTLFKRFLERHLEIESNMVQTYRELAEKADHPLIKALAEKLAENEMEHHKYFAELLQKI